MEHHIFLYDNVLLITLEGDLLGVGPEQNLIALVEHYVRNSIDHCIIDLSKVHHMNSTGLSFLVRVLGKINAGQGRLILIEPTEQVRKLFVITKLDRIFEVSLNRQEALASLLSKS